jgi:hypothetical protein
MSIVSCPKCSALTEKGGFHSWQIIVAICLFPVGLLALLAEKKPTRCFSCGFIW